MTDNLTIVYTESSCGWGGQEIRILMEAHGLAVRGHRVMLLCPPQARIYEAASRYGVTAAALPIARKHFDGLFALRRWLSSSPEIDVINTHSSTDSWLAALACRTLRNAPVIVRTRHISTPLDDNPATRWLYQRATAHVVTTGEALRRQLYREIKMPLRRITSVPTGVDLVRFRKRSSQEARAVLGLDQGRCYLGIVATLRSWKGHAYLIRAFHALAAEYPDWDLLIIGDGPQRHNLEALIGTLALKARVLMTGNRQDVELWLNAMDVFALPSYDGEGVPQSVLQAMACGLPVVSTTVGAIAEAVAHEQTGLLVPPHQVQFLRHALTRFMDNAQLRRAFGAAGRVRVEAHFKLERMLDTMEVIFRRVVKGTEVMCGVVGLFGSHHIPMAAWQINLKAFYLLTLWPLADPISHLIFETRNVAKNRNQRLR